MAGETSAELTIIVRAQDAASRVIGQIGRTIGQVLLAPLKLVGNAVGGLLKQFFGLKGLLVGGGIIAATRSLVQNLATASTAYKPLFSDATQAKINETASAFNRLGASLQATFARIAVEFDLANNLDSFSAWLRDNKDEILGVVRSIVGAMQDLKAIITSLATGGTSFAKLLGITGQNAFGIPTFDAAAGEANRAAVVNQSELWRRAVSLKDAPSVTQDIANESYQALMSAFRVAASRGGAEGESIVATVVGSDSTGELERIGRDLARITQNWTDAGPAVERVAEAMALGFGTGGDEGAIKAGLRASADEAERFNDRMKASGEIVQKVTAATEDFFTGTAQAVVTVEDLGKAVAELTPIIEGYLTVGEASELVASTITDGFQDLIQGTVNVGQAFGRMVSTILGELGRLLLYRSLLKLLVGAGTSLFGGAASGGGLGGGTDGAFGGGFEAPTGYASGGRVKGRTRARVGENGPEDVILPGGSQVIPSQRSRGGSGGDTYNIYGARDPKATARELAAVRGYSASARRAFA